MSDATTAEVEAANAELYAAFEAGDIDRMGQLWDESDGVTCVHPGWSMLRGRGPVLRSWSVIMANTTYIQFFLTDVEVRVSGELAVVTCTENILTAIDETATDDLEIDAQGGLAHPGRVVATNIFRRGAERWHLLLHHGSPVLAPEAEL